MFPLQAHLGGVPSRKGQVQAYLRLREHDLGPLDFDTPGGIDTTWHRIYLCLRSAFYPEAIEVRSLLLLLLCWLRGSEQQASSSVTRTSVWMCAEVSNESLSTLIRCIPAKMIDLRNGRYLNDI